MDRFVGLPRAPASMLRRFMGGVIVASIVGGCGSDPLRPVNPEYDLRDPSATRRLTAVSTVERTVDRTQIPTLIEMLDDDDASVRMTAGSTLKQLTGHDTGYRAYAPEEERRRHVALWRTWWNASNVNPQAPKPVLVPISGPGYTNGGSHGRSP